MALLDFLKGISGFSPSSNLAMGLLAAGRDPLHAGDYMMQGMQEYQRAQRQAQQDADNKKLRDNASESLYGAPAASIPITPPITGPGQFQQRQQAGAYNAPSSTGGVLNAVPEAQRPLLEGIAAGLGPQEALKQAYETNVPNVTGQEDNFSSFDAAHDPYGLGGVGQQNKRTGQITGYVRPEKPTSEETPTIKNAKALGLVPGTKDFNDYIRQDTLPRPAQPSDSGWSFLTDPGNNNHPYRANARSGQAFEAVGNTPYVPKGMARVGSQGTQQLFTPEQAKFYAQQALAGDKSVYASVGRNAAARTQIAQATFDLAQEQGLQGADLAAINAAFLGDQAAQRVVGQRTGAITVSGQEAKGVANLVNDAYAKLPRDQFRPFNQLRSMYETQTSSPEQAAAYMADFSLQTAYARALNPSGIPRESDIAKAEQLLNGAQSQEAHKAVVDQILREIQVIENSTGAARVTTVNRIRQARGLGKANLVESAQPDNQAGWTDLPGGIRIREKP